MARAVLLLHELPDGSSHYDWMIQRPGGSGEPLITFRVAGRIDIPQIHTFEAALLPDHRTTYLEYEGPVSDDRGRVTRVAEGDLVIEVLSAESVRFRGHLGAGAGTYVGRRVSPGRWEFAFTPR